MKTKIRNTIIFIFFIIGTIVQAQEDIAGLDEYYRIAYKDQERITTFIRQDINRLQQQNYLEFEGEKIMPKGFLPRFYQERDFRPAWSNFDSFNEAVKAIEPALFIRSLAN